MIGVTVFGLVFTPAFFALFQGIIDRREAKREQKKGRGDDGADAPRLPAPPDRPQLPAPEGA
jgi:hypothetical protein